jgi:sulfatase maturation enzyme AslB (radical SAM superfamily)
MTQNYNLEAINLSLSSACDANCIFCPTDRGRELKTKVMSPKIVEKIVREVSTNPKISSVAHLECGENGDAFLNPKALECLRIMRRGLPWCTISVFTNFRNLTIDKIIPILQERLIDAICCNIDGYNDYHYRAVKGVDLKKAKQNLSSFLQLRKDLHANIPLTIYAITYRKYVNTIKRNFGFLPHKLHRKELKDIKKDDFPLIKAKWLPLIDKEKDRIVSARAIFSWAERTRIDTASLVYDDYCCPNLERVKHEAFIAPDGTWYACCLDANNELVIGNIAKDSLVDLMESPRRIKLIRMLEDGKFREIGGPCKTVNCCQLILEAKFLNVLLAFAQAHPRFLKMLHAVKLPVD